MAAKSSPGRLSEDNGRSRSSSGTDDWSTSLSSEAKESASPENAPSRSYSHPTTQQDTRGSGGELRCPGAGAVRTGSAALSPPPRLPADYAVHQANREGPRDHVQSYDVFPEGSPDENEEQEEEEEEDGEFWAEEEEESESKTGGRHCHNDNDETPIDEAVTRASSGSPAPKLRDDCEYAEVYPTKQDASVDFGLPSAKQERCTFGRSAAVTVLPTAMPSSSTAPSAFRRQEVVAHPFRRASPVVRETYSVGYDSAVAESSEEQTRVSLPQQPMIVAQGCSIRRGLPVSKSATSLTMTTKTTDVTSLHTEGASEGSYGEPGAAGTSGVDASIEEIMRLHAHTAVDEPFATQAAKAQPPPPTRPPLPPPSAAASSASTTGALVTSSGHSSGQGVFTSLAHASPLVPVASASTPQGGVKGGRSASAAEADHPASSSPPQPAHPPADRGRRETSLSHERYKSDGTLSLDYQTSAMSPVLALGTEEEDSAATEEDEPPRGGDVDTAVLRRTTATGAIIEEQAAVGGTPVGAPKLLSACGRSRTVEDLLEEWKHHATADDIASSACEREASARPLTAMVASPLRYEVPVVASLVPNADAVMKEKALLDGTKPCAAFLAAVSSSVEKGITQVPSSQLSVSPQTKTVQLNVTITNVFNCTEPAMQRLSQGSAAVSQAPKLTASLSTAMTAPPRSALTMDRASAQHMQQQQQPTPSSPPFPSPVVSLYCRPLLIRLPRPSFGGIIPSLVGSCTGLRLFCRFVYFIIGVLIPGLMRGLLHLSVALAVVVVCLLTMNAVCLRWPALPVYVADVLDRIAPMLLPLRESLSSVWEAAQVPWW